MPRREKAKTRIVRRMVKPLHGMFLVVLSGPASVAPELEGSPVSAMNAKGSENPFQSWCSALGPPAQLVKLEIVAGPNSARGSRKSS
jgi:hypothetical protein